MKFQIDFNRESNDGLLEELGAKLITKITREEYYYHEIEFKTFEELEKFIEKVQEITGEYYSLVISNDPMSIYLDKDV